MPKLQVIISTELFDAVKDTAAQEDRTLTAVVTRALTDYLKGSK